MSSIQEFTCSSSNSGTTTDNLAGPGRATDNMFGYLGVRLELLLGKVSVAPSTRPASPQSIRPSSSRSPATDPINTHLTQDMLSMQEFTCTAPSTGSTDNLAGPGRTIDNMFIYFGVRLELLLGKAFVKVGKCPVATARRIRRNREKMSAMTTWHDEDCVCKDCRLQNGSGLRSKGAIIRSPARLKKLNRRINNDCKRLVGYIGSSQKSTQKQAIDTVLDLSIWDGEVRAMLKAHRADGAISSVHDINRGFRSKNREADIALADSSRKALVSLADGEINTLLKEWVLMMNLYKCSYDDHLQTKIELLWNQVSTYLWDASRAFLVIRTLRSGMPTYVYSLLHLTFGSIKDSPGHFEWSECEALVSVFCNNGLLSTDWTVIRPICAWLFKNADKISRIFETASLAWLINGNFRQGIYTYYEIQEAIFEGIRNEFGGELSLGSLQSRYTSQHLQPLLYDLVCPVTRMVRDFVRSDIDLFDQVPDSKEADFYNELANFMIAPDCAVQASTWRYADYFLEHDVYRCNMLLNALSQTTFSPPEGLAAFVESRRRQCIPEKKYCWTQYYRYCDSRGSVHIEKSIFRGQPPHEPIGLEVMEIPFDWTLEDQTERGEAFSDTGLFPITVASDVHERPMYLAEVQPSGSIGCIELRLPFRRAYAAIEVGTKTDDLRIEVHCPHGKVLATPHELHARVLRYAPEACAQVLGVDAKSLFTTGPFSWKPARMEDLRDSDAQRYRYKVLTIEEARASGYSEEEIYPTDLRKVLLPCHKECRSPYSAEEFEIDEIPADESGNRFEDDEVESCGDESNILEPERTCQEAGNEPAECGLDVATRQITECSKGNGLYSSILYQIISMNY